MKKRLLLTALTIVSALLSWAVWIAATTYMRAPRMVAELADTGALPFSPSELSRSRICALLVGDGDATFYTHHGVGLTDGHPGHTTITQAIGKRLFFKSFSPGLLHHRKIQLMIAAWAFDRRISKETQLKLFLNRVYLGNAEGKPVFGFPAAATAYYGKSLGQISDSEYLSLIAMLEAPNRDHVILRPKANTERVAWIRQQVQRACGTGCFQGEAPVPSSTATH
jgi:membrane carboxypeptidase/penicillin-binding protein